VTPEQRLASCKELDMGLASRIGETLLRGFRERAPVRVARRERRREVQHAVTYVG